jgi:hypothetical protein
MMKFSLQISLTSSTINGRNGSLPTSFKLLSIGFNLVWSLVGLTFMTKWFKKSI